MYGTAQANGKHCESVIQGMETDLRMAQLKQMENIVNQ